jgi:hypothetical protein
MIETATEDKLKVLHIRDFSPDLLAGLKIKAATERISLRELVIEILEDAITDKPRRSRARAS